MSDSLYGHARSYETEPHFSRHMEAMTAENLIGKGQIAAELAYRDRGIDRLRAELAAERVKTAALLDIAKPQSR